jgi:hypothetical protein
VIQNYTSPLGVEVAIDWPQGVALRQFGERVLEHHAFRPTEDPNLEADWRIQIETSEDGFAAPDGARSLASSEFGVDFLGLDDLVVLCRSRSGSEVNPTAARVRLVLDSAVQESDRRLDPDLYILLTFSLLVLFQTREMYAVHAASLERPDGLGLLLVGESDRGKSTLTLGLLSRGWRVLSDDTIFLSREDQAVTASTFRRDLGLDPEALDQFPEIRPHSETQLTDPSKHKFRVRELHPDRTAITCVPRVILFPEIADQPASELTPMKATESLVALMGQTSFLAFDPAATHRQMDVLQDLIRQSACYRLVGGHDLREDPGLLDEFLAEATPMSEK